MIRILDTNAIIELRKKGLAIKRELHCLIPRDIEEEIDNSEDQQWIRKNDFVKHSTNEIEYYLLYKEMINKHNRLVSFYSLKGLGDISILTTAKQLFLTQKSSLFPDMILVVTNDVDLKKAIRKEFLDNVQISSVDEFVNAI